MEFRVLEYIARRPICPSLLRAINHERESHGGRTEHELAILIIYHPLLLGCLTEIIDCHIFCHFGSGDGTLGVLGQIIIPSQIHTYLFENNTYRVNSSRGWLTNAFPRNIHNNITVLPQSFTEQWPFAQNPQVIAGYLNNYKQCLNVTTSTALAKRIDQSTLPGSVLITLGKFFFNQPHWQYEIVKIGGLPRGQMSWLCMISNPNCIMDSFYIYKYTKTDAPVDTRRRSNRLHQREPLRRHEISFSQFWDLNRCV